jgi:hypothetical protein
MFAVTMRVCQLSHEQQRARSASNLSDCVPSTHVSKNAHVVTGTQTIKLLLQPLCSQAVDKLCSHCLFLVVATSLEQAVNNY